MLRKGLLFFIILLLINSAEASVLLDRIVAIVGKDVITWSELYKAMSFEYEVKIRGLDAKQKEAFLKPLEKGFLEKLIDMRLQIAEAKKMKISVSDSEVKTAIESIRNRYGMDLDQFKKVLKKEGFGYNDYYQRIKDQILIRKFIQEEIDSRIVVSYSEIDEYYKTHKKEFPLDTSYRFAQIKLKKPESPREEQAIADEVKKIMDSLKKGTAFDDVIKEIKDNKYVLFAGDMDYISQRDIRNDFLKVVRNLKEGDVTSPIYAPDGIYILKIVKKQLPVKLEVIKDNIRNLLINNESEKRYKKWAKGLRQKSLIEILL
ncbi:chaperone SurA precursor [bacterium BMS3Bbin05]|nr:chaperone SurA precursor [bacterium BMS3Bbin05]